MIKHVILSIVLVAFACGGYAMSGSLPPQNGQPPGNNPDPGNNPAPGNNLTPENNLTQAHHERDALNYGVGYYLGREVSEGLRLDEIEVNLDQLRKGFDEGLREIKSTYPPDELDAIMYAVHKEMQARMVKRLLKENPAFRELSDRNRQRSLAYLARHADDEGVVTLDNGIQYRILEPGAGRSPGLDDTIVATYRGTLIDGSLFNEGSEVEVPVRSVLEGGQQILMMMREGARWQVALPPELAYGEAGDPPIIGPNEVLIFEVQLHAVK